MMNKLKDDILKLRNDGLTYDEIIKRLNCSKSTISYHCEKNGYGKDFLKYKSFNLSDDEINQILKLRNDGLNYYKIKEISNLSTDKIKLICRINNITDSNEFKKPSIKIISEIQEYYNECGSCKLVGEKFGYNRQTISKYITTKNRKNTIDRKKSMSKNVIEWRKRKKIELIDYKGGCCEVCGYNKTIRSLDFHHKDPKLKDFTISGKSYSFERLKNEVDKCILVCSNCHGEIHEEIDINGYSDIINNI